MPNSAILLCPTPLSPMPNSVIPLCPTPLLFGTEIAYGAGSAPPHHRPLRHARQRLQAVLLLAVAARPDERAGQT
eukprot:2000321-Rhodomonas_salina.1